MNLSFLKFLLTAYIKRNRIILSNPEQSINAHQLNLHWWRIPGEKQNVGDYLSKVIVEYLASKSDLIDCGHTTRHLYAVGSIIDASYQDATVWGSGLLRSQSRYWWRHLRRLDIRCVRGPLTRQALLENGYDCPEVYGDPALLMPMIYQPTSHEKNYDYRIIRHLGDYATSDPHELSPIVADWRSFIDAIAQSKLIISSSLHGIILAEAYHVPAILLEKPGMNLFKYRDYYHSTRRPDFPIASTVAQALTLKPLPLPDLSVLQSNLLASFPSDIWDDKK